MSSDRLLNILLMGETGNGKSTLINSFYNYSKYESFSNALTGPELCLIATNFKIQDDNFESQTISSGVNDGNECLEAGQSSTMSTKSYLFPPIDRFRLRLIDSSGFAATQGPEQDAESVRDIIDYISQYDALHAIAIVLKGNSARLTAQFEYCIEQVMVNLNKSAINNLVFIFTHCTKAGDSVTTVRTSLEQMKIASPSTPVIKLTRSNCFFFENDGFRVLMTAKRGVPPSSSEATLAETNWQLASAEFRRLLRYVAGLTPHDVKATLSINDARVFAQDISLIAQDILSNIAENKKSLQEQKKQIDGIDVTIKNFDMNCLASIRVHDITYEDIEKPNVICKSEKCTMRYQLSDGQTKTHYSDPCCKQCDRLSLYWCSVFKGHVVNVTCAKCKCPLSDHDRIYYETSKSTVEVVNEEQKTKLDNAKSDKERKEIAIKTIEDYLTKLELEKSAIQGAIAKLSAFIKSNAILLYNKRADEYAGMRKETQRAMSRDEKTVKRLDAVLSEQMTQSGPPQHVTLLDIQTLKKRLLLMDIYGPKIRSVLQETERGKRKVNREVVV